eukprot:TRINITY_DN62121_c0_g1_i1.p1 TRINITY_DN62121_c0_g1~~TRINITY_DN62121_c0_g1_i1.p1  ORF type:complete len:251 (-),score=64.29 TRINITY_DN62121_c0_g1_i1:62-814(-)
MEWKKLLLLAGGSAATGAVIWYLLKEKSSGEQKAKSKGDKAVKPKKPQDVTCEETLQLLQEVLQAQAKMKKETKSLTQELCQTPMSFDATYDRVKQVQPEDPLERHGMSMTDFDKCLENHQSDPNVRDLIAKIMGAPDVGSFSSDKVQSVDVSKLLEIHEFMLQELQQIQEALQKNPRRDFFDQKTLTITAQVIIGWKTEVKFGVNTDEVESAVMQKHLHLSTDQKFQELNFKIQHIMSEMMGTVFKQPA